MPSTSTESTMPTMTASTGASLVVGVRRAELPCVKSTHSTTPAPTLSTATTELPEICSLPSLLTYGWISRSFIPRNLSSFCVATTLPITFAINMATYLDLGYGSSRALLKSVTAAQPAVGTYLGNTVLRLPCGRAITCTLCTSPAARAAAAPASTAARTEPTSPCTNTEHRPLPILFQPTNSTLAAFSIASVACTSATRPFVSIIPIASLAIFVLLNSSCSVGCADYFNMLSTSASCGRAITCDDTN